MYRTLKSSCTLSDVYVTVTEHRIKNIFKVYELILFDLDLYTADEKEK